MNLTVPAGDVVVETVGVDAVVEEPGVVAVVEVWVVTVDVEELVEVAGGVPQAETAVDSSKNKVIGKVIFLNFIKLSPFCFGLLY
jgi:hypothetical protein